MLSQLSPHPGAVGSQEMGTMGQGIEARGGSAGGGCLMGTRWRCREFQRGGKSRADHYLGCVLSWPTATVPLVGAGSTGTCCRAGTQVRQARPPGAEFKEAPSWVLILFSHESQRRVPLSLVPWAPCLPRSHPGPGLACARPVLGGGQQLPVPSPDAPQGHGAALSLCCLAHLSLVFFFLTFVLSGNVYLLEDLASPL